MSNKDWYVIIGIIITTVVTALLLNLLLSTKGFIPTEFENSQWLSFWASYLTGIFALIIGYLAISFANKNSEKALQQQKIEDETRDEIKKLSAQISVALNSMQKAQDNMEHTSVLFLKRINQIDFTKICY